MDINNYPFCTIEPNIGVVEVPDEGVDNLADMFLSKKKLVEKLKVILDENDLSKI